MVTNIPRPFVLVAVLIVSLPTRSTLAGPTGPVPGIPSIDQAQLVRSSETGRAFIRLSGSFPPSAEGECWSVRGFEAQGLWLQMVKQDPCMAPSERWNSTFDLGVLDPGSHDVWLGLEFPNFDHDPVFSEDVLDVSISASTPAARIPYATEVHVTSARGSSPILTPDSVRVVVRGVFPGACYSIVDAVILDPAQPGRRTLRLMVDRGGCRTSCPGDAGFEASWTFPPSKAGTNEVLIETIEVDCSAPGVEKAWNLAPVSFEVEKPPPCLTSGFYYGYLACLDIGYAEGATKLWIATTSDTALLELAGEITIDPPQFSVKALTPRGRAEGTRVAWESIPTGARFRLEAAGAPLPSCLNYSTTGYSDSQGCLVLEVDLVPRGDVRGPTLVKVRNLPSLAPPDVIVEPCLQYAEGELVICAGGLSLLGARPNPFSGGTTIVFSLKNTADVDIEILDLGGRLVATPHQGRYRSGQHTVMWDGTGTEGSALPSGVYFARVTARTEGMVLTDSRRLVLVRGQ